MELRLAQSAVDDLQAIQEYYLQQGVPDIGKQYVTDILKHTDMLKQHPDSGRIVPEFDLNHIRELIHPPFRLVYVKQEKSLVLIRVWRSERQLQLSGHHT